MSQRMAINDAHTKFAGSGRKFEVDASQQSLRCQSPGGNVRYYKCTDSTFHTYSVLPWKLADDEQQELEDSLELHHYRGTDMEGEGTK